jgi:hypothetical protein
MYVFGANSPSRPILLRILTCSFICRHKAALPRARTTHLKVLDRRHHIFQGPNKVKTQIQPPPFIVGLQPKSPFTVRSEREKKISTLAPATLSKSTEGVRSIKKPCVSRSSAKMRSSQQFYLMMDWPSAACQVFSGDYAESKNPFCSGMNPPGLSQIVEDIIRHKR